MDVLALPVLGALVLSFFVYIGIAWLGDKRRRALTIDEDDPDDEI